MNENGYRDIEIDAISGFLTGQYNYNIIFAFLKIGAAYTHTEINQQNVLDYRNPAASDHNNVIQNYHDILPAINFGAGIHITDYVELFVAYQQLLGSTNDTQNEYTAEGPLKMPSQPNDISMISVGLNVGNFDH